MINIVGFFCSVCGKPVDVRDGGKTQVYSCEHQGSIIDAKLSGTLFGPNATIPVADIPAEHADAFFAKHGDCRTVRADGTPCVPASIWLDYMQAFHSDPSPAVRASRLQATIAKILAKTGIAQFLRKPLPVFVCSACQQPCQSNLLGTLTRQCGHDQDPILARVASNMRGRTRVGASAIGCRM
jgi:hypothetical protein